MIRKTLASLICMALTIPTIALADGDKPISVFVDGQQLNFEVPPMIKDGSTLVPLRALFEKFGMKVYWDASTQTITGTKDGLNIQMQVGEKNATVNGQSVTLEVPPTIIEGSTLVPLRFVGEVSGNEIGWDGVNHRINVTTHGQINLGNTSTETTSNVKQTDIKYLELSKPYKSEENEMTVTVTKIEVVDKGGFYEYNFTYEQKNNTTDKAIDEATFKIYYDNGDSEPQYGFFGKLMPTESISRTYTFKATKSQKAFCLEYGTKTFFSKQPSTNTLKWKVSLNP
ncbi:copper amine oxidase N-terminal domain-containing protein [Paenibacillus sp. LjRoot56]|uniref:copper amine oxidase N-terminal domain-containing protein n=1 Tax=Paenibacillus sp. LjRoot56 TaxID=3342333 RepID=UPI003ED10FE1